MTKQPMCMRGLQPHRTYFGVCCVEALCLPCTRWKSATKGEGR